MDLVETAFTYVSENKNILKQICSVAIDLTLTKSGTESEPGQTGDQESNFVRWIVKIILTNRALLIFAFVIFALGASIKVKHLKEKNKQQAK